MKLCIGSGDWKNWGPEWIMLDGSPDSPADYIAMVPPLPDAVKAMRFTEILCVHMIEHIAPWRALELAKECYTILEPGGVFILEQPNILYCARVLLGYIESPPEEFEGQYSMAGLYGDSTTENELMLHRWGYEPSTMMRMLHQSGFALNKIDFLPTQFHGSRERDFRVEATK
jgi:predicted SAM-dependent methyltransferase